MDMQHAEQLPLVEAPVVRPRAPRPLPAALQLSDRTRRIGLAGIAQARAVLAQQAARRTDDDGAHHPAPAADAQDRAAA